MRLLFVIDSFFPYGVATSSRARTFCLLFKSVGYDVHVITMYTNDNSLTPDEIYDLGYCTFQFVKKGKDTSLASFKKCPQLMSAVESFLLTNTTDVLFSTRCCMDFDSLVSVAKKYNVPYYIEQCEWLDVSNYRFGKFDVRYIRSNRLQNGGYKKATGIISISRLLDDHYKSIGIPSIRIPTILDIEGTPYSTRGLSGEKINIVYTGNPGTSKEFLKPVIENLAQDESLKKIYFHIYGPSKELVLANIGGDEKLLTLAGENVVIHGKVPQTEMEKVLREADFQMFVRPNRKSSNAGFPTKLGESMAVGTPVIANDTGDICLYLKDMENGFVIDGNTTEAVGAVLKRVVALDSAKYEIMRSNARKTAEKVFDYRRYKDMVTDYFMSNAEP